MRPLGVNEDPQFFVNIAYITTRAETRTSVDNLLNSLGISYNRSSTVENGLTEYVVILNFDQYNILGGMIRNNNINCVLSRTKNTAIGIAQSGYNPNDPNQSKVVITGLLNAGAQLLRTNTSGKILYITDIYYFDTVNAHVIQLFDDAGGAGTAVDTRLMYPDPTTSPYTGAVDLHLTTPIRFANAVYITASGTVNMYYTLGGWEQNV